MIRIAIIGGTGSGKSFLSRFLCQKYHALWLDCDQIGHRLLNEGPIQMQIKEAFGETVMEGNEVNRKALGKIVFQDKKALKKLNQILHPPIVEALKSGLKGAEKEGYQLCVLDGALLMDVKVRDFVDMVWAVTAPEPIRLQRLLQGRKMSPKEAERIMNNQISPEQYQAYADVVINTNQSLDCLGPEIEKILGF